ncbi:winged helix-turn-helix transcriptional regulator [Streptomyces sp. NPDC058405]|uniref:winged helix-turn-helix transcriptional regulator n=1 Tax=unclassified Streptomyces TaxID=2593676 RepID=UPI00364F6947
MSRMRHMPRRRSYDQYCAAARALDAVGDRWTLLIVRELLAGPRRYTDLHADLPGVSTDVLASRLKDMERDELATRRRLPPPAAAYVYELTERGRGLLPVLTALAEWGAPALDERRPTDAVRAHWFAVPLLPVLEGLSGPDGSGGSGGSDGGSSPGGPGVGVGVVEVRLDEGAFHIRLGDGEPAYGDGPADHPDARLVLDADTCRALTGGALTVGDAVRDGRIEVSGEGTLAKVLRGE